MQRTRLVVRSALEQLPGPNRNCDVGASKVPSEVGEIQPAAGLKN